MTNPTKLGKRIVMHGDIANPIAIITNGKASRFV